MLIGATLAVPIQAQLPIFNTQNATLAMVSQIQQNRQFIKHVSCIILKVDHSDFLTAKVVCLNNFLGE